MNAQHQQDPAAAALAHTESGVPSKDEALGEHTILAAPRRRQVGDRNLLVRGAEELSYRVAQVTAALALLLAIAIVASLLLQVFFRYVLNAPLAWTDELSIFFFAWTMLLLASIGVRERTHVRFTFIIDILPPRAVLLLDMVMMALIAGFGFCLLLFGQDLVDLVWDNLSPAVHYPLQYLYISMPVQGVLLMLHAVTNVLIDLGTEPTRSLP